MHERLERWSKPLVNLDWQSRILSPKQYSLYIRQGNTALDKEHTTANHVASVRRVYKSLELRGKRMIRTKQRY